MQIHILSVNIGMSQPLNTKSGFTGIFKTPVNNVVLVNAEGLANDTIVDRDNHGGGDQAVYVYCQDDYDWWQQHESLRTKPGLFGENLTVAGMSTHDAHIGARLIGDNIVLEITSPRTPCKTLATRMNNNTFPKRFWASRLTGFYCRVISPGTVAAGEHMLLQPHNGQRITMKEWIDNEPLENMEATTRQRFLSVPIHHKARAKLQS